MNLTRGTFNLLLVIGIYMLFTWGTRAFTFYTQLQSGTLVAPGVHFSLVVVGLLIGVYLSYLGVKGRAATRRSSRGARTEARVE